MFSKVACKIQLSLMKKMYPNMAYPEEIENYYMEDMPRIPIKTLVTIYQTYKNENSDVWRAFESLSKKYATEIEAYNIRCYNFAIDSLGCTQELKDILLAARYCKTM